MPKILICLFAVFLSVDLCRASEPVSFRSDVAPILLENCLACHSAKKAEGGYRVDNYEQLFKAGDSGEVPIATEKNKESELVRRLLCKDESERMPAESDPLAPQQIETIKNWIEAGAKFDGENKGDPLALVIPAPKYADPPQTYSKPIPITTLCFSPDGKQLIAGGYHELTVWNVADAKLIRRIGNLGQRIFSITFHSDGKTIAVGCGEPGKSGELRLVDFASGDVKGVIARSNDAVLDAAFRPASDEIAIASADSTIRICNTKTLAEIRTIASHADWVTAVSWSDDGKLLASASRDKTAKVFDGQRGELLSSYAGHGAAVRGIAILSDSKQIITTGADKHYHRWNIEAAKRVAHVAIGGESYKLIRNNDFILIPCTDNHLRRLNLADNKISTTFQGHSDWVLSTAIDPTGTYAASGAFNGEVIIWNLSDGMKTKSWIAKP